MQTENVRKLLTENPKPLWMHFYNREEDPRGKSMLQFAQELVSTGITLKMMERPEGLSEELPCLALSAEGPPRHYYLAVPSGLEWNPFFDLIKSLSTGKVFLSPVSLTILKDLKRPITIRVLITPSCPFCAKMVALVNQLAAAGLLITAWIMDIELFPEWSRRYHPKAAPLTILNEEVFLTGLVQEKELVWWLENRGSQVYRERLYRNDLLEKRTGLTIKRLKDHPQDLSTFAGLIKDDAFGIKLGAMAVIEQVIEETPDLHGVLLEALLPLLRESSDQVVGDAAYLMGFLHDRRKIPILEKLLSHPNPEIVEAARDGLAAD